MKPLTSHCRHTRPDRRSRLITVTPFARCERSVPGSQFGARSERTSRSGFTLMELTVSLLAGAVLIAGMGSSIFLATRANDVNIGPFQERNRAGETLHELSRELSHAVSLDDTASNERSIQFRVPDRTGDGIAERLRYAWSGTSGDPLELILHDGRSRRLLENVHHFKLGYHTRTVVNVFEQESPQQHWVSQSSSYFENSYHLGSEQGVGTDFVPSLPADAISWSVTDVSLRCRSNGPTDGVIRAQVTTADDWRRPAAIIDEVLVYESDLPSQLNWHTVSFPNAHGLIPGERACVLFLYESGEQHVLTARIQTLSLDSPETWLLTTGQGGSTWQQHPLQDLSIRIRGTYTSTYTEESYFNMLVTTELQVGENPHSRMRTSVRTLTEPEVSTP